MKEYYFYKQKGFNANNREEIQINFTPFEILTRYQPKDYNLPNVSNEQVETYKSELIKKAKEKNFTLNYSEQDYYYLTQCKEIKKEAEYFLIGKFDKVNGKFSTKKEDFIYKYLAVLDYENLSFTTEEFYKLIQSKLANYSHMIYKSVSYTETHPRFRLIVDTNREMNEQENTSTIKSIANLIGVEPDTASYTYSQIQGLPLTINGNEYKPMINYGLPFPVQKAVKEEKKVKVEYTTSNISTNDMSLSDEDFKEMFIRYLELDHENINTGDSEEYNRALSILLSLARDFCYNIITYDVACECSDLLANIGATPDEYKQGNLNKINHAIRSWENDPNYFNNEKSYSMLHRFEIVGNKKDKDFTYLVRYKLNQPISSTGELHWRLFTIGEQWRVENTTINEKTGKETVSQMPFYMIAKFLLENISIKKSGTSEETSLLYFYDYSRGIYTSNEDYIKTCIKKLEVRFKLTKLKDITEDLRANTRFEKTYRPEHLVAVGNGLFNTKTKELEPFDPKYFITAKVVTNYNSNAVQNHEAIKEQFFNYDEWLKSIACNDEEVITLLWQLTNEALNPNKTRRKIAIMLGSGTNGKSTFRQVLVNLIGDTNVSSATPHELQSRFGLTSLEGKICNYGDEVGTKPLDEMDKLKSISSGESVNYERKRKDVRSYDFKTLLLFNSNGVPPIKDKSEAVLNRLLIIPFKANFEGIKDESIKDVKLKNKIVLEYILYKALHLDFDKFIAPNIVQQELMKYRTENDSVYSFMLHYIDKDYHHISSFPIAKLTGEYEQYCYDNGYNSRKRIGIQFEKHINNHFKGQNYMYVVKNCRLTEANISELRRYGVSVSELLIDKPINSLNKVVINND